MGLASGVFFAIAEIGGFAGPLLMGTMFDFTGSLLAGIFVLAAFNFVIATLAFFVKQPLEPALAPRNL